MSRITVVGAGIGGIATAIRLAVKGHSVDVFEANPCPGGKLSEIEIEGFRFDAGPSLFTMPQYVEELFSLAGKNPSDYFSYRPLDIICKYFYPDGTKITAWADQQKFVEEVAQKTSDTKEAVNKFLKNAGTIYAITSPVFLEKSLHKLSTYFSRRTLRSLFNIGRIDPFRSMDKANNAFFRDPKTVQLFNRYATYNGSNPYKAPATLNVIPHLELGLGACFPEGGMYSITRSLVKLAEELGVRFHFNAPVQDIVLEKGRVIGVTTEAGFRAADKVVSNMDVWFTYKKLLRNSPFPKRVLNQERSSSALIFYWGISASFPQLQLHNIFFSEDYRAEFKAIWEGKTICDDPTIYLNISSKYKPDDAPEGAENWFVMINAPADEGQDWDELISKAKQWILAKLSLHLNTDIRGLIVAESVLDPRLIESRTSSYQGSLYGSSSNSRFAAFFRHPNFSSEIKDLYFVGGSVHPGGGIPLALLSARIVADCCK